MPIAITERTCTQKVAKQTKFYDSRCSGFYVSVTSKGVASFSFKYWNAAANKQASVQIGIHDPEHLTVERARNAAFDLKARNGRGENIGQQVRVVREQKGVIVDRIIDDFIAEISTLEKKADGEMRAVLESWKNVEGFLNREVRPAIGWMVAAEVTNNEIAVIQQRIAKRSVSGARQTRSAMKRLFAFGSEAGRPYGLTSNPVHNLPKIKKEHERTVVLTEEEIRTLWWGLDHPDLPCIRSVALGLKFELVSMLRTSEFRNARRSFIVGNGTDTPVLRVPMKFVKKRRVIEQPLNSLAVEIINEATSTHHNDVIFSCRMLDRDAVLNRNAFCRALIGGKTRLGILEFLGLKHFTPHDLRRTAATLCGDLGITDGEIAKCLDHRKDRGENVVEAPSVTGRVYVQSRRLTEKRAVLDALDTELRRIIGKRPEQLREAA